MNWSEADKSGDAGRWGLLPTDEPLLLSGRILLLETELISLQQELVTGARKPCYWLDWSCNSCQKSLSLSDGILLRWTVRYSLGETGCSLKMLHDSWLKHRRRRVEGFLGSIWNCAASPWRPCSSLALWAAWKLPSLSFPWQRTFSSPVKVIYALLLSEGFLNSSLPRHCLQLNLSSGFSGSQGFTSYPVLWLVWKGEREGLLFSPPTLKSPHSPGAMWPPGGDGWAIIVKGLKTRQGSLG